MLGRHHFLLSMGTATTILAPLFSSSPHLVSVLLIGIGIGSLIPDVDSKDATIFHRNIKGIHNKDVRVLSNSFANIFPFFGYTTKYLIYKPSIVFYDRLVFENYSLKSKHRGYMHSFLGLGTATVLTGAYFGILLYALDLISVIYLSIFLLGYLLGGLLHLLQDSCTKTGIQWNYPFQNWRIKGNLITASEKEHTAYQNYFAFLLAGTTAIMLILPHTGIQAPLYYFLSLGLFLSGFYWLIFVTAVSRAKLIKR